ncbi:MAG: type III secretion system export apparatus subunit SctS [Desulfosarcinaceae bacterium]|jgi:type III secretion HrpO family protein
MHDPILTDLTHKALMLVLLLSLPPIIVAAVVGILVSLVQAVTQIQDQTLSFAFRLVAVIITLMVTVSWLGQQVLVFATNIFENIITYV